jgi:splicing factor 3B subunit 3
MYFLLPNDTKMMIAGELDRSVREIERKISVSQPVSDGFWDGAANDIIGYANEGGVLIILMVIPASVCEGL